MILEGPGKQCLNFEDPKETTFEVQRSRQVALAARTPQRIRAAFEKLNSQAAKDGTPGSAVPGNSHGAGAPSQGNPGAEKGRKQSRLGTPAPRSARPSQLHFSFFCLIVTQRAWVAEAKPDGRGRGRGTSSKQPRAAPRDFPGLRRPVRLPAAPAPHALRRREPRRSRGQAAAGGRLVPGSVWGPGAPPVATPARPVSRTRRSGLARSLTINNGGISFVWTVWKEGKTWGSREESGGGGERGAE